MKHEWCRVRTEWVPQNRILLAYNRLHTQLEETGLKQVTLNYLTYNRPHNKLEETGLMWVMLNYLTYKNQHKETSLKCVMLKRLDRSGSC